MSLPSALEMPFFAGFPRVSGDEPSKPCPLGYVSGFSPRERG